MDKVAIINELYFDQKKTLTEIAEVIQTSISYISKILRKNERYTIEKEKRKKENLIKRRNTQKEMIYKKRENNIDIAYIGMQREHEQATRELSKRSTIGNNALRKYCSSAYLYNKKKKCYVFDTATLLKPADFPLYIKA